MNITDALRLLELSTPISKAGLKKAYRDALLVWHPERFTENNDLRNKAEAKTYLINEAYALLSRIPESDHPYRPPVRQGPQRPDGAPDFPMAPSPRKRLQATVPRFPTAPPPKPAGIQRSLNTANSAWNINEFLEDKIPNSVYTITAWILVAGVVLFLLIMHRPTPNTYSSGSGLSPSNQRLADKMRREMEYTQRIGEEIIKSSEQLRKIESLKIGPLPPLQKNEPKPFPQLIGPAPNLNVIKQPGSDPNLRHLATDQRLLSGTVIYDALANSGGKGKLIISNGLSEDAQVKLIQHEQLVAKFYVRGSQSFGLDHIPDGEFTILYCVGFGWDDSRKDFTRGRSAHRYDRPLAFSTQRIQQGNQIFINTDVLTLTLHTVPNGNATTSSIALDEFDKY